MWPTGPSAPWLRDLMEASRDIVGASDLDATQIWLWGQGPQPQLPSFAATHGVEAGMVTAVDLVRGLGVLTDMDIVDVPGATGWYDTDYEAKRDAALAGLEAGADLFVIHVEATDEAGHAGDVEEKVKALEAWDRRILADLVPGLDAMGPWRLLLLPDHGTPLRTKTHTAEPVPVPPRRLGRRRPRRHLLRGRPSPTRSRCPATPSSPPWSPPPPDPVIRIRRFSRRIRHTFVYESSRGRRGPASSSRGVGQEEPAGYARRRPRGVVRRSPPAPQRDLTPPTPVPAPRRGATDPRSPRAPRQ